MRKGTVVTRRGFITGTTLGVASMGLGLPSILKAGARGARITATRTEPSILLLDRNESPYGMPPSSERAVGNATSWKSPRYTRDEPAALIEAITKRLGVENRNCGH